MSNSAPRLIRLTHSLPGRMRLRLAWLHEVPAEAAPLADALAELDPSIEVQVRPWTGSVLCTWDPESLDADEIVTAVRRHTGVAIVLGPDESHPDLDPHLAARRQEGVSRVRLSVTRGFRELNQEIMRTSDGRLDLGTLTGLGFIGLGAAEIASSRRLPAPPWFNLAWWAFRTFTIGGEGGAEEEAGEVGDDAGE